MPDDNASSYGDIHRVFGTILRNFQTAVRSIDHLLMHTLYLIAKDDSIPIIIYRCKIL